MKTMWTRRISALGVALALAGCGGGDDAEAPPPEASATLGAAGGKLALPDGAELLVPAGALSADMKLRIVKSRASAPELPEGTSADLPVYEITPHGTVFNRPVTLRLPVPAGTTDPTALVAPSAEAGWGTQQGRITGSGSSLMLEVERVSLSWYSVAFPGLAACAVRPGNTDPHPCSWGILGASALSASPAAAYDAATSTVTQTARLSTTFSFSAQPDCGNGRIVVRRSWRPADLSAAQGTTVVDTALPLTVSTIQGSNRARGSLPFSFEVDHLSNGAHSYSVEASCTRGYQGRRVTATGVLSLSVNAPVPAQPPKFTRQPVSLSVTAGATASFSADYTAAPDEQLSQLWQRSNDGGTTWTTLGAGTNTSEGSGLVFTAVLADHGSRYKVTVCAGTGPRQSCLDSDVVTLSVTAPASQAPQIIVEPSDQTLSAQGTASFVVSATGNPQVAISWDAGTGFTLPGAGSFTDGPCSFDHVAHGDTLSLSAVSAGCIGRRFQATVSNSAGSVVSRQALLLGVAPTATLLAGAPGATGAADGPLAQARFSTPNYLAVNASGHIAVGDFGNHTVRVVAAGNVSTLAGAPGQPGHGDGTGGSVRFNGPGGLAFDSAGNLFVADWDNHVIRRITPAGVVSTLAGTPGQAGSFDSTGAGARFSNPNGLAVDAAGNVYVADFSYSVIRRITPAGVVTTLAGLAGQTGSTDGTGSAARFWMPSGLAMLSGGRLVVADQGNHTLRLVDTATGAVTTLAGTAGDARHVDGAAATARLSSPAWVAASASGSVFVVSAAGDTVRRVAPDGSVQTVAGVAGDGAAVVTGLNPRLRHARGVWVDAAGTEILLLADHALLRIVLP